MLGKTLTCENPKCRNKFYRSPNDMLSHNYCSSSCAAIVNNQKYPKWPKKFCKVCGKEFKNRESKYCSSKCGWSSFHYSHVPKYSKEQIISAIQKYNSKNGRIPAKRELAEISHKAIHIFGSWNTAVLAAGLTPNRSHDNRMYKRALAIAEDGHKCDSISELIIDNWLAKNKIPHTRDAHYPTTNHKADWTIQNGKVFIEYFGLAKDSPRYDREIKVKKKLCKKNGIKLVEIYPRDLYPATSLNTKLGEFI